MDMIIINDIPITIDFLKEHLEYDVPYTYKNIVDRLGLPYKKTSRTSKESQLKQLSRGLRYEIRNKKYYILEIYDEFEPEGIRSVWSSLIKVQLMCYLRNHEGYSATHSLNRWYELLGFVNDQYRVYGREPDKLFAIMTTLPGTGTYKRTIFDNNFSIFRHEWGRNRFHQIFYRALDDLMKKRILDYEEDIIVIYDGIIRENNPICHVVNDQEHKIILDIEKSVLIDMGKKKYDDVRFRDDLREEYYRKCHSEFCKWFEKEHGFVHAHTRYARETKVIYSTKYIDQEIYEEKTSLNDKIYALVNDRIDKLADKAEAFKLDDSYRKDRRYVSFRRNVQHELAEKCIKIPD